nr:pentatricopeptide repeat-containing protein At4g32450, mitochondrial-like [Tanacetum cinerariifolium]
MSQLVTTKTIKSLNLVYKKVRYYDAHSLSFVINYYTTSTAAAVTNNFQNPNGFTPVSDDYVSNRSHNAHFHQNPNFRFYANTNTYRNESQDDPGNYNNNYQNIPQYDGNVSKLNKVVEEEGLGGTIEELDAFCKERKLKEAVEVLGILMQNGVSVDLPRYLFLMNECGEAQALEQAKQVHEFFVSSVENVDVSVCNKVLEMYSKCGCMEDAYKVFNKMLQRNLTTWDAMITGFAKNGHGEDAIDMFTDFKKIGFTPDSQMFYGVFTACSVVGDMKEGLLHFESMSKDYNIVPSMEHYKSVVDMLGSVGYLNEALEFIEKMPIEPTVQVWETLLKQCRVYGETELGDRCCELVQLLDPSRLDEQSKACLIPVKASDIAKEKEKQKLSGYNPLENKTKVYEYRAGDKSHPEHEKLYSQLRCLKKPMKEVGYVPETKPVLHDIDPESKEEALLAHSERLALSQALLTSSPRAPIRIIKNLRVCVDCHNALKIISKTVGRLIVARDAKRFHHFENGFIYAAREQKGKFPASLPNLKTLELTTTINAFTMNVLIRILRCCPNLESLHLLIEKGTINNRIWALHEIETRKILHDHLKTVNFLRFNGKKRRVGIARFLLQQGNALEKMFFSWRSKVRKFPIHNSLGTISTPSIELIVPLQTKPPKKPSERYGVHQARPGRQKCFHTVGGKKKRRTLATRTGGCTATQIDIRVEKGVPVGQLKPQAKEGKMLGSSFEAMLHVPESVSKKLKKNETPLTALVAGRTLGPKKCVTQKIITIRADTGSPKSAKQTMKTTSPTMVVVWFDKIPPESIENYEMLRKAFLGNYSQQKKYIKDPVEIHHIKQREGESMKAFMERFKVESMHVIGAPECMRISGFIHGITNSDLIKKLNDNIPKSVDEMMSVTTTFLRGEVAAANQLKKKAPSAWKHHETGHRPNFDKRLDFKSQHKSSRRQDRFTPLTKTPKKILAMDTVKFKARHP